MSRWWSNPFWKTPGQEDRVLQLEAGLLQGAFLNALLLASGQTALALCGTAMLLLEIWVLLHDTVEPGRAYGVRRFVAGLMDEVLPLSFLVQAGLLILPSLLVASAFPGLLWFAGALYFAVSLAGGLARFLRPLGGAHLCAAGLGIALAALLQSPLVLAAAAVFLVVAAGAWTQMSRADLRDLMPRPWRRQLSTGLAELEASPPDAAGSPEEVTDCADEPLSDGAFTFQLSAWVACHLDGRTADDPEHLRQELARPVPNSRLPLCRRILAHAIQFQEGPFVRELVQNVLDEATRIGASSWRRILKIDCRAAGPHLLEIEVADLLGMSFATVVNDLLVPNRTSKSARDWGTIGRFGQGFFTTLREAESVRVRSFRRTSADGGWDLDVLLTPVWCEGCLHDVSVSLSTVWRRGPSRKEGTVITWRGGRSGGDFVDDAQEEVRQMLQNIPVEQLYIDLDGGRVNEPSSNYARVPTLLGPLRLFAQKTGRQDLLITKNSLPVTQVSRTSAKDFFPEAPERLLDFLFAGGIVLDLPAGLPVNRSRNALAARETFAGSLSRDMVRASLLAEIEYALRTEPWPAALRRKAVSPDPSDWSERSERARNLGERISTGEATLEDLSRSARFGSFRTGYSYVERSDLLLAIPCIRDRRSGVRRSLPQIGGASWTALLRSALPWPNRPLKTALFSRKRRGFLGYLARLMRWSYSNLWVVALVVFLLLILAFPLRFLGQQVGLWALGACLVYFLVRIGVEASSRTLLALTVPIGDIPPGRSRHSVWDALGSIAQDGAVLLLQSSSEIPERRPDCHLYRKISPVIAFASQGLGLIGNISWNAQAMTKGWDVRHLLRYLRSRGNFAATEAFRPWLERFLFLLTHETVHLLERAGSTTHEEEFYRRQRRLLEKVLSQEDDFMTLCEREARRTVRWTWSPAWLFLVWRSAKQRRWDLVERG